MLVGHLKLRTNIRVAGVAKLRLRLREQRSGCSRFVNGMAIVTRHAVVGVRRSLDVEAARVSRMASKTDIHSLLRFHL
jgi:hypothetical protein